MALVGVTKDNFKLKNPDDAIKHIKHNKSVSARGTHKHRSFCQECASVVFGGTYGVNEWHTVYTGTLNPEFRDEYPPTIAMFVKDKPKWANIQGLQEYEGMPPPVPGTEK